MCCVYCSVGVGSGLFHDVSLVSPLGLDRLHNQAAIGQSHGKFCLCVISFTHSVHTQPILPVMPHVYCVGMSSMCIVYVLNV